MKKTNYLTKVVAYFFSKQNGSAYKTLNHWAKLTTKALPTNY